MSDMTIWDDVHETEEFIEIKSQFNKLQERCQQLEDICLRVSALQNGFRNTMQNEKEMIEQHELCISESNHAQFMINFIRFSKLHRRIEKIEIFFKDLMENSRKEIQDYFFNTIHDMLTLTKQSYNICIDILIRLSQKQVIIYVLSEELPIAFTVEKQYIEQYRFEKED